ncbi:hypothetical protein ACEWY4_018502 [Coilia grayii]|uniref:SH3 domain-containing protein n=1 Tax=Coilia grayii TaxID=363190 RepID=A0ABD1JDP7_9TELE
MQQHIYRQRNEEFEVFTTVFSPQDELELSQGDVILVLFKHEESRWYGRLQNGQQGYFPASHVTELIEEDESANDGGVSLRTSSEGGVLTAEVPASAGPPATPGLRRRLSLMCGDERPFVALRRQSTAACSSPRLLHRILSKHRRKSESHGASNRAFEPE